MTRDLERLIGILAFVVQKLLLKPNFWLKSNPPQSNLANLGKCHNTPADLARELYKPF